jgi:hypothetical protein
MAAGAFTVPVPDRPEAEPAPGPGPGPAPGFSKRGRSGADEPWPAL